MGDGSRVGRDVYESTVDCVTVARPDTEVQAEDEYTIVTSGLSDTTPDTEADTETTAEFDVKVVAECMEV